MSIRKRKDSYRADFTYKGVRHRATFSTELEAQHWEKDMLFKLRNGVSITLKSDLWSLKEGFLNTYKLEWANTRGEKTQRINGKQLMKYFGEDTLLDEITTERVAEFMLQCRLKGNTPATINRKFSCLSKIFTTAQDFNKCNQKPKFNWQKEPEGRIRWLTYEEEDEYLDYFIENVDIKDLIKISCDTGMRVSETLSVPFSDYQNGFVRIWINKSDKPRSVALTSRVKEIIGRRQMMDPDGELPISISYNWCQKLIKRASEELGYPDVTIHTFRHTFASRLVQAGRPLFSVQKLMGHKTTAMTQKYAHLAPDHGVEDISVLEMRRTDLGQIGDKMGQMGQIFKNGKPLTN